MGQFDIEQHTGKQLNIFLSYCMTSICPMDGNLSSIQDSKDSNFQHPSSWSETLWNIGVLFVKKKWLEFLLSFHHFIF